MSLLSDEYPLPTAIGILIVFTIVTGSALCAGISDYRTDYAEYHDADAGKSYVFWSMPIIDGDRHVSLNLTRTYHGITDTDLEDIRVDPYIPRNPYVFCDCSMINTCVPYALGQTLSSLEDSIAQAEALTGHTYDDYERALVLKNFVNGIGYRLDCDNYGCDEYWATPAETLYAGKGDCDDKSILFVTLGRLMSLDTALIVSEHHVQGGIALEGEYGASVKGYTVVECCYGCGSFSLSEGSEREAGSRILVPSLISDAFTGFGAYMTGWARFVSPVVELLK